MSADAAPPGHATADYEFDLPAELIAQHPLPERDAGRLMVVDRTARSFRPGRVRDLPDLLRPGDLLVVNNSRVIPARLRGRRAGSGGDVELLLLEPAGGAEWWALVRPGKRLRPGARVLLGLAGELTAEITARNEAGHARVAFPGVPDVRPWLERLGEPPLPPYIARAVPDPADRERYQTTYAREAGSVAAPTAGLHLSSGLRSRLQARGVGWAELTLHVGPGTFAPVQAARLADHVMHEERFTLPAAAVAAVAAARARGGRVVAVGTTTLRVLESVAAASGGRLAPGPGRTRLFVHPPHRFRVADALLTNFHLPRSTLLMLVSAFAEPGGRGGRELILAAYAAAVRERFRFFSYGDAMLLF
jgi:S-adenosylmethionine:tRNA ribosyltransferase-isomerase